MPPPWWYVNTILRKGVSSPYAPPAVKAGEMNLLETLFHHHGVQPVNTALAQLSSTQPASQENSMSFLASVGNFFRKALHIGEVVATVAEPLVLTAFPDVAPLYTSAIGLAISAESSAAAATGTGPQKLANVLTTLKPLAEQFFAKNGIQMDDAALSKWTSAVVDTLNMIPAPTKAAPSTNMSAAA